LGAIRINPEIMIRIPDHVWLRKRKFKELCALGVGGGVVSLSALCSRVNENKRLFPDRFCKIWNALPLLKLLISSDVWILCA